MINFDIYLWPHLFLLPQKYLFLTKILSRTPVKKSFALSIYPNQARPRKRGWQESEWAYVAFLLADFLSAPTPRDDVDFLGTFFMVRRYNEWTKIEREKKKRSKEKGNEP